MEDLVLLPFNDDLLKRAPKPFDFDKDDPKEIKDKLIGKMRELGGVGFC